MATLNEIIYILKNEINDYSNDYKVSNRQFEFMINTWRARLIKQDIDKKKQLSSNVIQNLGPVPMIRQNITDNPLIPAGDILASVSMIPNPLETNDRDLFTYIGGLDRNSPFDFSSRSYASHWSRYNPYTSSRKRSYFRDNRIYVSGCDQLPITSLWVEGVFQDPRDVWKFKNANTGTSNCAIVYEEEPYPMSEYMITILTKAIKENELDLKLALPNDTKNDGSSGLDEITSEVRKK